MTKVRLIDANALKEIQIYALVNDKSIENGISFAPITCVLKEEIDNAPTVEINDKSLEIAQKSIELGRRFGRLEGRTARPRGEWKYKIDGFHSGGFDYCSICNFPTPIYLEKPNFCPNCGADMREEVES